MARLSGFFEPGSRVSVIAPPEGDFRDMVIKLYKAAGAADRLRAALRQAKIWKEDEGRGFRRQLTAPELFSPAMPWHGALQGLDQWQSLLCDHYGLDPAHPALAKTWYDATQNMRHSLMQTRLSETVKDNPISLTNGTELKEDSYGQRSCPIPEVISFLSYQMAQLADQFRHYSKTPASNAKLAEFTRAEIIKDLREIAGNKEFKLPLSPALYSHRLVGESVAWAIFQNAPATLFILTSGEERHRRQDCARRWKLEDAKSGRGK